MVVKFTVEERMYKCEVVYVSLLLHVTITALPGHHIFTLFLCSTAMLMSMCIFSLISVVIQ